MGFTKHQKNRSVDGDPIFTVHSWGGYISQAALDEYFRRGGGYINEVVLLTDSERSMLAIDRDGDGADAYTVSHKDSGGGQIAVRNAILDGHGVDIRNLEQAHRTEIAVDDETGYLIVDLSPVVGELADAVHCPECGRRFAPSGLKQHIKKAHEGTWAKDLEEMDPEDIGGSVPDGDDSWKDINQKATGVSE